MVQMKLGSSYFPVSITVLENSSLDMLFGLDTLRRYRCCIDLSKNVLRMNDGFERIEEVAFLGDGEIPQKKEDIDGGQGLLGGGGAPTLGGVAASIFGAGSVPSPSGGGGGAPPFGGGGAPPPRGDGGPLALGWPGGGGGPVAERSGVVAVVVRDVEKVVDNKKSL